MKATEIRKGMVVRHEKDLYRVLTMQHITPGNWRGMVQTRLRNLKSGSNTEVRFRSEDDIEKVDLETRSMQYMYHDHHGYHFMDTDTYEQVALLDEALGDTMSYILPESTISMEWCEGQPVGVDLPSAVDLRVKETAPGIKGATASAQRKPATLDRLVFRFPSFIEQERWSPISTQTEATELA
jgi:elongation factor P